MKEIELALLVSNLLNREYAANGYTYGYIGASGTVETFNWYYPQATRNFLGFRKLTVLISAPGTCPLKSPNSAGFGPFSGQAASAGQGWYFRDCDGGRALPALPLMPRPYGVEKYFRPDFNFTAPALLTHA
ncbi:MAG: hypothetical protein WKG07_19010 [Hymenobacter sp.]